MLSWAKDAWEKIIEKHQEPEEVTIKGWVAREQFGNIRFGTQKPIKGKEQWFFNIPCWIIDLPYSEFKNHFDSVQWPDEEPTPVTILIRQGYDSYND